MREESGERAPERWLAESMDEALLVSRNLDLHTSVRIGVTLAPAGTPRMMAPIAITFALGACLMLGRRRNFLGHRRPWTRNWF
jgi:hypothetical protein